MGRRLNISTPTVINTELVPLDDSFYIEANGQTEQWYYDNTNQFAPNRITTPLTLTPKISAFDQDTQTSYVPSFQSIGWYEQAWDETQQDYVETLITNHVDSSSAEYVISNNNLIVKKNVPYTHAITIRCAAVYTDPRDAGVSCTVETMVVLLTNRDAEVISPTLDILCPPSLAFNPLKDYSSNVATRSKTMKAIASWAGIIPTELLSCKVDPFGTEELIPNNIENLVTCTPYLDIRYGVTEQQDQQFFYRQTSGGAVNPIDGNTSYVSKIKGNTVMWNQLSTTSYNKYEGAGSNIAISIDGTKCTVTDTGYNGSGGDAIMIRNIVNDTTTSHKYIVLVHSGIIQGEGLNIPMFEGVHTLTNLLSLRDDVWYGMFTATHSSTSLFFKYSGTKAIGDSWYFDKPMLLDLTLIFGAGNEPSTVEEFESWLDANIGLKDYYPYNAGELIPVRMTALKTVGFNLWDEEYINNAAYNNQGGLFVSTHTASKNPIRLVQGVTYKNTTGHTLFAFTYDENMKVKRIDLRLDTYGVTPLAGERYMNFYIYNEPLYNKNTDSNPIAIYINNASRTTYEPHWEDLSVFDVTTVKGKLEGQGQDVYIFPYGMKKVGTIQDEIKVENGVVKAIKRVESVDLGSLTWTYTTNKPSFYSKTLQNIKCGNANTVTNTINYKYVNTAWNLISTDTNMLSSIHRSDMVYINIQDRSYTDAATFKNAMSGVMLYYELATYEEYTIDPSTLPRGFFEWYGVENGVEVKADTLPWYVSGQNTDTLTIDPMYGEKIAVVLRAKKNQSDTSLYPAKAYRNVIWRVPNIDTHVVCANGGAVRSDTQRMDFSSISNANGEVLDDNTKLEQLAFKWVSRRNNESVENNQGWGHEKSITAGDLRNTIGAGQSSLASTMVFPYVYLKGAFEKITDNSELVTDGGETVYDRPIE